MFRPYKAGVDDIQPWAMEVEVEVEEMGRKMFRPYKAGVDDIQPWAMEVEEMGRKMFRPYKARADGIQPWAMEVVEIGRRMFRPYTRPGRMVFSRGRCGRWRRLGEGCFAPTGCGW